MEKLHTPKIEGVEIVSASWSPMLCILCKRLPASTEGSVSGRCATVAMAGHVARRTGAESAAWSIGRPTAMTVAEATTHRGVAVAITRHWTVAVVH